MPIIGVIASSAKGAPAAPVSVSATDVGTARAYNNGAATVSFTPGAGATATSFTATSSPGGFTATGASSPLTVTGLQSSVSYTFTVTATNASGTSPASSASNSITATTVPQAPTIGTATAGNAQATVTFTGNATGGKAISTYTATSSPGSITGASATSPITVTGLTNGTAYTFTVTATNANGTSTASAASNSVTPVVPTSFDSIATASGTGSSDTITFSSISQSYKHLQLRCIMRNTVAGVGQDDVIVQFNGDTGLNYSYHRLYGSTSGISASGTSDDNWMLSGPFVVPTNGNLANAMGVIIIDIYDYTSTAKNKSIKAIGGINVNTTNLNAISISTGVYRNTSAVTSISLKQSGSNWASGSRFALYGIKG